MIWDEMIQLRKHKERNHLNPFKLVQPNVNTAMDYYNCLSFLEEAAINFRFFCEMPIGRVADRMGMSWDGADALIDRAVSKLLTRIRKPSVKPKGKNKRIALQERGLHETVLEKSF